MLLGRIPFLYAFNRTIVELKCGRNLLLNSGQIPFNRTIVELKLR